jgi:catechol 2,3-dioxygenase-like lactoylglutathione lyase family enzyme
MESMLQHHRVNRRVSETGYRMGCLLLSYGCLDCIENDMKVNRIVANIASLQVDKAAQFYRDILGLELLMDHGWIQTFGSSEKMKVQISIASEGGSGTPVPDFSIEVDDLDAVLSAVKNAGHRIEYGPASEPWGVRRFYVRDPFGKLLNILQHA